MLKPLGRFCVAAATELSPPGPWALDRSKGHALRASPFSILSHSYPETAVESFKKRQIFRPSPIWQDRLHDWDIDRKRYTARDLLHTASTVIDAGVQV